MRRRKLILKMSHIVKIAPDALPTLKVVISQQIRYCEKYISEYPNPSWGSRTWKYKVFKQQNGAAERALSIMSNMLINLNLGFVTQHDLDVFGGIVFSVQLFLVNFRYADKQPTTKDMILKFENNIKNGLFTFNV